MDSQLIRNFCIVAHVDHGKSTLADRLMELTHLFPEGRHVDLYLDKMDLEKERGITIKAQSVRLTYGARDGKTYTLNLIDTPGHVDFSYEVSRSLAACEGAVLLVDATQGVQAQTVANTHLADNAGLTIIPVINKIDMPNADPDVVKEEIEQALGLDASEALEVSARTGDGVEDLLEEIVAKVPPPAGTRDAATRALIFDSIYDAYRGVVAFVRIVDGELKPKMKVKMMATGLTAEIEEVGVIAPDMTPVEGLTAGEVGYVITGVKDVSYMKVGDTLTGDKESAEAPLAGYRDPKPMVYAGLYPTEGEEYGNVREALIKLKLNDGSLVFEPESSPALGFGFRCGFLGLLHMEIVQERLEREFNVSLLVTAPHVNYHVYLKNRTDLMINNPGDFPSAGDIERIEEPFVVATILTPAEFVGPVMELCQKRRGSLQNIAYISSRTTELVYEFALAQVIKDFFNALKAVSKGYATYDYELTEYKASDLVKVDILLAGTKVDALSVISYRDAAPFEGRKLAEKLKETISRQLFEVSIQAAIGGKIIARENVSALRKDVIAKLYGGDVTRKRKLLEKQKKGKKRMKTIGKVDIPQEAFLSLLKID
jgi:GTP-binding protein LepA